MKKFAVVRFFADNSVEFVPSKWITAVNNSASVKFPRTKTPSLVLLQRDAESEPNPNWPEWDIEVKKFYDSCTKAEEKAQKYVVSSDIESSSNERESRKRPRVHAVEAVTSHLTSPVNPFFAQNLLQVEREPPLNLIGPTLTPPTSTENLSNLPAQISEPTFVVSCGNEPLLELILKEQRAFQEKSLHNQEVLIQETRELKTLLQKSLTQPAADVRSDDGLFALIPIKNDQQFRDLEGRLEQLENFNKLVHLYDRFGRLSISQTVGDILSNLFELEYSRAVRYTAVSGKIPFRDRKLAEVVREAVRKNHPSAKEREINDRIAVWFRGSSDRGGGRKSRHGNAKEDNETEGTAIGGTGAEENPSPAPPNEISDSSQLVDQIP